MSSLGERARLFVALELPVEVRLRLAAWARAAIGEDPGLRLVVEESLHVTLCFLGSVEVGVVPAIVESCAGALRGDGPVPLRVMGPLWLPRRRPRVLAVELADEQGLVGRCQAALSHALAEGGWYTPETRPYLPHVTVARVRGGRGASARAEIGSPTSESFRAGTVALMRSHLGPGGARYERTAAFAL